MSALVAMHGFWLLLILPIACLVGWRVAGGRWQRFAAWLPVAATAGLFIWMAVVGIKGTDLTESIGDRVWHSIGTVVTSINVPLVQLLLGGLIVSSWPIFGKRKRDVEPERLDDPQSDQSAPSPVEA